MAKKYKTTPTIKQRKAVEIMAENGWVASRAMIEAWYSPKSANKPSKLTESSWYKQLLREYIPKKLILEKLRRWLENMSDSEILWHLTLASKIQGLQVDKSSIEQLNVSVDLPVDSEQKKQIAKQLLENN